MMPCFQLTCFSSVAEQNRPQLRKSTAKFAVAQLLCYVFREQNHGLRLHKRSGRLNTAVEETISGLTRLHQDFSATGSTSRRRFSALGESTNPVMNIKYWVPPTISTIFYYLSWKYFYPKSYMWDSPVPDISEYLSNFQLGVHIWSMFRPFLL